MKAGPAPPTKEKASQGLAADNGLVPGDCPPDPAASRSLLTTDCWEDFPASALFWSLDPPQAAIVNTANMAATIHHNLFLGPSWVPRRLLGVRERASVTRKQPSKMVWMIRASRSPLPFLAAF